MSGDYFRDFVETLTNTGVEIWEKNLKVTLLTEFAPNRPWFKWEWLLYGRIRVLLEMDLGFLGISVFYKGEFKDMHALAKSKLSEPDEMPTFADDAEEIRYRLNLLDRVAKELLWEM
jgi:hypothetical protein